MNTKLLRTFKAGTASLTTYIDLHDGADKAMAWASQLVAEGKATIEHVSDYKRQNYPLPNRSLAMQVTVRGEVLRADLPEEVRGQVGKMEYNFIAEGSYLASRYAVRLTDRTVDVLGPDGGLRYSTKATGEYLERCRKHVMKTDRGAYLAAQ